MTGRGGRKGELRETVVSTEARAVVFEVAREAVNQPPADINETAEDLLIRIEVPGVAAEDIQVVVHGSKVEVSGEKRPERLARSAAILCLERSFGPFRRVFDLAGCFDMAAVRAELKGGILTVAIPKRAERRGQARRIPIAVPGRDVSGEGGA